jgi:5-methylcytosine-specific restriction endonuclease McrA
MDYLHIAEDLVSKDFMKQWDSRTLAIWLRDACRCAYCGKDMLSCPDTVSFGSRIDHLLPVAKYPELEHVGWNCLLACSACHARKQDWDPNISDGYAPVYARGSQTLADPDRYELVTRARSYLTTQKLPAKANFEKERDLILRTLRTLGMRQDQPAPPRANSKSAA